MVIQNARLFLAFLAAVSLAACASPQQNSASKAVRFTPAFAAQFSDNARAGEAWLNNGAFAFAAIGDKIYPPLPNEEFERRALARLQKVRAANPELTPETLSFVALDGLLTDDSDVKPDRNAVIGVVYARETGRSADTLVSIVSGEAHSGETLDENRIAFEKENEFGVPLLRAPQLNASVDRLAAPAPVRQGLAVYWGPMILDLRGNYGGLLDAAPKLAATFLKPGATVLQVETAPRERTIYEAQAPLWDGSYGPVLVLIDKETNAGALAIAAALQHHGVAKIAGASADKIKDSIETVRPLTRCPPGVRHCAIRYPSGLLLTPVGVRLSQGVSVDYPSDTDDQSLQRVINAWKASDAFSP